MMLLLDTHVLVWMSEDSPELPRHVGQAIDDAAQNDDVLVSAWAFWEVGQLVSKRRLELQRPIRDWMGDVLGTPGLVLTPFTAEIAVDCSALPGEFNRDPADRVFVTTARALGATLVTRDRDMLRYGEAGHVSVLAA